MNDLLRQSRLTDFQQLLLQSRYIPAWAHQARKKRLIGVVYAAVIFYNIAAAVAMAIYPTIAAEGVSVGIIAAVTALGASVPIAAAIAAVIAPIYAASRVCAEEAEALIWGIIGADVPDFAQFTTLFDQVMAQRRLAATTAIMATATIREVDANKYNEEEQH